jgi:hypothetical protein
VTVLKRYWFEFSGGAEALPAGLGFGCGVTAFDRADAEALLRERVFGGAEPPPVANVIENVSVPDLEAGHVLPNMDPPSSRGVWFPRGYG